MNSKWFVKITSCTSTDLLNDVQIILIFVVEFRMPFKVLFLSVHELELDASGIFVAIFNMLAKVNGVVDNIRK